MVAGNIRRRDDYPVRLLRFDSMALCLSSATIQNMPQSSSHNDFFSALDGRGDQLNMIGFFHFLLVSFRFRIASANARH
jgi:hypothetical protein